MCPPSSRLSPPGRPHRRAWAGSEQSRQRAAWGVVWLLLKTVHLAKAALQLKALNVIQAHKDVQVAGAPSVVGVCDELPNDLVVLQASITKHLRHSRDT